MFATDTQKVAVESKQSNGYTMLGTTKSLVNGLSAFLLVKGKHTVVINSLGYDEHVVGMTWKVEE